MFYWYGFQIFIRLSVTIPVTPVITSIIIHFIFHIRFTSIHKLLYFSFFSASLCVIFLSAGIATSISVHVLVYYYYYYYHHHHHHHLLYAGYLYLYS